MASDSTGELKREQLLAVLRSELDSAEAELGRRRCLEQALASVSREFTAAVRPNFDRALACLGQAVAVHRVRVFRFREQYTRVDNVLEWCVEGLESQQPLMQDLESGHFAWWLARIQHGEDIVIPDVSALPGEASAERQMLESQGACAVLAVPLLDPAGQLDGFIGFLDVERPRIWSGDDARILHIAGEMFAVAYSREAAERELKYKSQELQASLAAKSAFLSIVSHELRAPLMVVLGHTDLLLDRARSADRRQDIEALESMIAQSLRLRRMIDELLGQASQYEDALPAAPRPRYGNGPRAAIPRTTSAERPRIVVIDDDRDALDLVKMMLEDEFEVVGFASPGVALAHLDRNDADLILLDWMMPGMDGLAVLAQLQQAETTADVPVVFISGKADADSTAEALASGATAFVAKPFTRAELLGEVRRHCRRQRDAT